MRLLTGLPTQPLLVAIAAAMVGCTAPSGDDPEALSEGVGFLGLMWVEQQEGTQLGSSRASEVGGAFATFRGLDAATVLGLLGRETALMPCDRVQGLAAVEGFAGHSNGDRFLEAFVDLHDVGELTVAVGDDGLLLRSRTFPDVAGVVSGAFYAEDTPLLGARAETDSIFLDASIAATELVAPLGFDRVGLEDGERRRWWVSQEQASEAPEQPADPPESPTAEEVLTLAEGQDATLRWPAGDPADRVEVLLRAEEELVRCLVPDDGSVTFPAEVLSSLPATDQAQLTLRRIRQEPASASVEGVLGPDGPREGTVWFSAVVSRTLPLVVGR